MSKIQQSLSNTSTSAVHRISTLLSTSQHGAGHRIGSALVYINFTQNRFLEK